MTPDLPDNPSPVEETGEVDRIQDPESDSPVTTRPTAQVHRRTEFYRGPLPTPLDLREYEETLEGAADRILSMAERKQHLAELQLEQEERRQDQIHTETITLLQGQLQIEGRGQWMGFCIGLAAMVLSVYLISTGAPTATIVGVAALISALAGLVGPFLWATFTNRRNKMEAGQTSDLALPDPPHLTGPRLTSTESTES